MKRSATVTRAEIRSEPRQPSRLEKKKNMAALQPQASVLHQGAYQRQQSLMFRSAAAGASELSESR